MSFGHFEGEAAEGMRLSQRSAASVGTVHAGAAWHGKHCTVWGAAGVAAVRAQQQGQVQRSARGVAGRGAADDSAASPRQRNAARRTVGLGKAPETGGGYPGVA